MVGFGYGFYDIGLTYQNQQLKNGEKHYCVDIVECVEIISRIYHISEDFFQKEHLIVFYS